MSTTNFGDDTGPDDHLAARLRDALTSEAAMVTPSDDGLQQIRSGIDQQTKRPWWKHPATPALAAALVLGVMAGGIAVFAGGDNKDDNVVATQPSTGTSASESAQPEPSDPPATGTPTPAAAEHDVYVYYVMDDGQSPRLYREQHSVGFAGNMPNGTGVDFMLSQPPMDRDYSSLWPKGTKVLDVRQSGDTATIDLSDFPHLGAEAESLAVQQVVYTTTANDPAVKQVKLLVNGKAPQSGHDDWSKPVARAPMMDVQGWIWLLAPTEDATTSSPVAIQGYGTAFEGTISWEVTKNGVKVAEGTTQGGSNGEFGDFSDTVELAPGSYQIRAFEASAEDGSPIHVDTKMFTVK